MFHFHDLTLHGKNFRHKIYFNRDFHRLSSNNHLSGLKWSPVKNKCSWKEHYRKFSVSSTIGCSNFFSNKHMIEFLDRVYWPTKYTKCRRISHRKIIRYDRSTKWILITVDNIRPMFLLVGWFSSLLIFDKTNKLHKFYIVS